MYGHIVLEGYVINTCFAVHENETKLLAILSGALLCAVQLPVGFQENRMEPISEQIAKPLYRRIDKGMQTVLSNPYNGDIFVTGEDKFLKKYDYPADPFSKLDFKKAPGAPTEELKSHDI